MGDDSIEIVAKYFSKIFSSSKPTKENINGVDDKIYIISHL